MKILLLIAVSIVIAVVFWKLGNLLGVKIGKMQEKQKEVKRNGSKHI